MRNVLNGHTGLRTLAARCDRLEQLSALVAAHVSPALRPYCRVANVVDGALILSCDSAAWTTRLRFHAPTLLAALRAQPELADLREIRVRVTAPQTPAASAPAHVPYLPRSAADHLMAAAACIEVPALKAALLRLATRAAPDRNTDPASGKHSR